MLQVKEASLTGQKYEIARWAGEPIYNSEMGKPELGPGQEIETEMAVLTNLKVFRIIQRQSFEIAHVEALTRNDVEAIWASVNDWYENGAVDLDLVEIGMECCAVDDVRCAPYE